MLEKKFKGENDQRQQKQEQAQAVDAVHVLHKICFGPVGIRLAQV
jgi:hypothetical protein